MDGVTLYLPGVLTGVFITIACAAWAFCRGAGEFYIDQGDPRND